MATKASEALSLIGSLIPAGVIMPYGGATAPTGWLLCDGSSKLRADYPALYGAIGDAWGTADGTHFNLPDMRGRFPRGVDGGIARDPDRASRTACNTGGNTGDNVGTVQTEQYKQHNHAQQACFPGGTTVSRALNLFTTIDNNFQTAYSVTDAGGNETRPINANVNYIIKI